MVSPRGFPLGLPDRRPRAPLPARRSLASFPQGAGAFDEALAKTALGAEPPFEASHPAAVRRGVVIVTQQVQESVQCEDLQLDGKRVSGRMSLTAGRLDRDHD